MAPKIFFAGTTSGFDDFSVAGADFAAAKFDAGSAFTAAGFVPDFGFLAFAGASDCGPAVSDWAVPAAAAAFAA
jgi:hypothetical protein